MAFISMCDVPSRCLSLASPPTSLTDVHFPFQRPSVGLHLHTPNVNVIYRQAE